MFLLQASFAWMSAHPSKFDDHFLRNKVKSRMGLPNDSQVSIGKVRKGGGIVGSQKMIPNEVKALLEKRWDDSIQKKTGLKTYSEMRAENARRKHGD